MTDIASVNAKPSAGEQARRDLGVGEDTVSRDLIVAAAGELIREIGYTAITVDGVRRRAGVSRATFYFYFRNKTHLLISAASTVMDELFDVAGLRYPGRDEFARIVLATVAYLSVWQRQSAILGEVYALSLIDAEVREVYDRYRCKVERRITERLERLLAQQRIPECEPGLLAASLSSMVEFAAFRFFCHKGDLIAENYDVVDLVETLSEAWYRAVHGKTPGYRYDYAQHRTAGAHSELSWGSTLGTA